MPTLEFKRTTPETIKELRTRFAALKSQNHKPFDIIMATIQKLKCSEIVIEHNYIDKDFLAEYSLFYSTCFKDYPRFCTRLHFFCGGTIAELGLIDHPNKWGMFNKEEIIKLQENYLGFSVIRPIDINTVGRTIIKPYIENYDYEFVLSQCNAQVNINGVYLNAMGMPFLQQDTQSGVCASSVLWMVSRYLHHKFDYGKYTLPEITSAANKYGGGSRPFPATDGLNSEQIVSALIDMDVGPIVYSFSDVDKTNGKYIWERPPESIVYKYLESELPVILALDIPGVGGHVSLVIGHNFLKQKHSKRKIYLKNVDYINTFIVHDDAGGPYLRMPFSKRVGGETPYSLSNVFRIIIPAHKKLFLRGEDVEEQAEVLLYEQLKQIKGLLSLINNKSFLKYYNEKKLVIRTYYLPSNQFKESISYSGMLPSIAQIYKEMDMPKYIWITEISSPHYLQEDKKYKRFIYGEIITDSTGGTYNPENFLAIHCPGFAWLRYPNRYVIDEGSKLVEERNIIVPLPKDKPYNSPTRLDHYLSC